MLNTYVWQYIFMEQIKKWCKFPSIKFWLIKIFWQVSCFHFEWTLHITTLPPEKSGSVSSYRFLENWTDNLFSWLKEFPCTNIIPIYFQIFYYVQIKYFLVGTDLLREIQALNQVSLTSDLLATKICQKISSRGTFLFKQEHWEDVQIWDEVIAGYSRL